MSSIIGRGFRLQILIEKQEQEAEEVLALTVAVKERIRLLIQNKPEFSFDIL